MNDKQWTVAAVRFSVWLSDVKLVPAICLPRKEEPASELTPQQKR